MPVLLMFATEMT